MHKCVLLKKNFINKFFLLVFFILTSGLYIYFGQSASFSGDDTFYTRYMPDEKLTDSLKFSLFHGGGYIGLFLCRFFSSALPNMLNIHPEDFICTPYSLIKGIFAGFIIFSAARFFSFFFRLKSISVLFCVLILIYYIYALDCTSYFTIITDYAFYRYFFSLLFYGIFWHYILKNIFVKYNKISPLKMAAACFAGYALGSSSEILFFSSAFAAVLIFLLRKKYNLNINFYLPVSCLFISMVLFVSSSGFRDIAMHRGLSSLEYCISGFSGFNRMFIQKCIIDEYIFWIVFIILAVSAAVISYKKQEIYKVIIPVLMMFSVLTAVYSLVLCGKTFDGHFFLEHISIIFIFKMLMLYPAGLLFSYIFRFAAKKMKIYAVMLLYISAAALLFLFLVNFDKGNAENTLKQRFKFRKAEYVLHKMMRFYYIKNECPILPLSYLNEYFPEYLEETHKKVTLYALSKIYKNPEIMTIGYTAENYAFEKYYENGGSFTRFELENIKFSRLLNDNFVLNSPAEMKELYNLQ